MAHWVRYDHRGALGFGVLRNGVISIFDGDMFANPVPTGATVALEDVNVLPPAQPSKIVCLWNNSRELAAKLNIAIPSEPLYFLKATTSAVGTGDSIKAPDSYSGKVVYEGELGVVIGTRCRSVPEGDAARHVFGYTCVNDVTAAEIVNRDAAFAQWTRAKSFDTFAPLGPVIGPGASVALDNTGLVHSHEWRTSI